jgi:hypothetical protein
MAQQREPKLVTEEASAEVPENAGDVFGKPEPNGTVYLCPFDVTDGEIGFAENSDLCAVLTNGNRWISLRFTTPMAIVIGEKLMECAAKTVKVH